MILGKKTSRARAKASMSGRAPRNGQTVIFAGGVDTRGKVCWPRLGHGDGPAPLIATALLTAFGSGYAVAAYILFCAIVSIVTTALLPDYTNRDISGEDA